MNIFDLDRPEGGIYICTTLLLFLGACLALPLYVISRRTRTEEAPDQEQKMPWWGAIALVIPYLAPLIPGSDRWVVPKGIAFPLIGLAFLLGGVMGIIALVGLFVSIVRLIMQ